MLQTLQNEVGCYKIKLQNENVTECYKMLQHEITKWK